MNEVTLNPIEFARYSNELSSVTSALAGLIQTLKGTFGQEEDDYTMKFDSKFSSIDNDSIIHQFSFKLKDKTLFEVKYGFKYEQSSLNISKNKNFGTKIEEVLNHSAIIYKMDLSVSTFG